MDESVANGLGPSDETERSSERASDRREDAERRWLRLGQFLDGLTASHGPVDEELVRMYTDLLTRA